MITPNRLDDIFEEAIKDDNSYTEDNSYLSLLLKSFFGKDKFTLKEIRKAWQSGIKRGIEIGYNKQSIQGQSVDIKNYPFSSNKNHNDFLKEYDLLTIKYSCGLAFDLDKGMTIFDVQNYKTKNVITPNENNFKTYKCK
jgi:hypothetical protein